MNSFPLINYLIDDINNLVSCFLSNFQFNNECPLENKCLTPRVIYEADVITLDTSRKFYIGFSDTPFKERYNNHKRDFRNKRCKRSTENSKYIWSLQESGIELTVHGKILSHVKGISKLGYCNLCLTEKIMAAPLF